MYDILDTHFLKFSFQNISHFSFQLTSQKKQISILSMYSNDDDKQKIFMNSEYQMGSQQVEILTKVFNLKCVRLKTMNKSCLLNTNIKAAEFHSPLRIFCLRQAILTLDVPCFLLWNVAIASVIIIILISEKY